MRRLLTLLLFPLLLCAQPLADRIAETLQSSATARRGLWGIHIVNLTTGETVFAYQQDRFFVPASTAKLFSTALALERLGPGYRFTTSILSTREPDANGRLAGDLRLTGGGDPTLSGRVFPYKKNAGAGNPLGAIEELADAVVARGVKRVDGDIVGDDTAYVWEPYPAGRSQEDAVWDYGAPVSALTVNDNRISLVVRPGRRAGDPAQIRVSPTLDYFAIENRVVTVAGGKSNVRVDRSNGSRQLRVWGTIPAGAAPEGRSLAVDDPAQFAAATLWDALIRRGVQVIGRPVARHRLPGESAPPRSAAASSGVELARRLSPPLEDILTVVNKESQNLHAELLLEEVGRALGREGSRAAGLEQLGRFLAEAGVPLEEVQMVDASGLSVLDMVTPQAMTRLLAYMDRSENRAAWMNSLAVAGEEGTLSQRFQEDPAAKRIRAKTGTLSHTSAIGGYALTAGGDTFAFAILVNNYAAPASEVRAVIDRIGMLLVR
jgi:D-alanyl-D-alanine carboxypeptidase/D-alanyl-D-alanine-endopeptidase (penicillin-binding protein 4)